MPGRTARRAAAMTVIGAAQFVLLLDLTIVNVALPTIQRELDVPPGQLQWLVTGYALTYGGFLLLAGRAADTFGRLRVFVAGLLVFGVASAAAGAAVDHLVLVAARAGQGVGAAFVSPAALALVTTTWPEGPERNRALGILAAAASAGGAGGLLLGGAITQWAGWRWIFLVNLPIVAVAVLAALLVLSDDRGRVHRALNAAGAVTSTLGLLALVYGLTRAGSHGFDDPAAVVVLIAAAVLAAVFVATERGAPDPLVPVRLLRSPRLLGVNLISFAVSTSIAATPYFLTLYLQHVLELSPARTGLAFLPMTVVITVTTTLAARRAERIGVERLLLVGIGALVLAALLLSRARTDGSYLSDVLPGMLLFAVGLAAAYTAVGIGGTTGVPDADQGIAGGLLTSVKQVGGAVGLAVLVLVAMGSGDLGAQMDAALVEGLGDAYLATLGFAALAASAAVVLLRRRGGWRTPAAARPTRNAGGDGEDSGGESEEVPCPRATPLRARSTSS
jgi:EmrB/QacA subfamily drug resistance transporter